MLKKLNTRYSLYGAALLTGVVLYADNAAAQNVVRGNNFSDIARNISSSIEELPGLIASMSYLVGMLMGTLGVVKIKDHVENPSQTPMKEGAVRLAAGGALFALPMLFESMQNTIGVTSNSVSPAELNRAQFSLR